MTKSRMIAWGPLLAVLLCFWTPTAEANTGRARRYYKRAERHYAKGQYEKALGLYRKAYRQKPLAGFHFNMGLCLRKLGRHQEAVAQFRLYLKKSKSQRNTPRARELLAKSEAALRAAKRPEPTEDPPKPPVVVEQKPAPEASPKKRDYRVLDPVWFWVGTAVSSTLLVAGVVTGIVALAKSSRFKDPDTPKSELQNLEDVGKATKTTSTVTFTMGAVAASATVVLYLLTDWNKSERRRRAPMVSLGTDGNGGMLTVVGQF